jgi:hypothetical protein
VDENQVGKKRRARRTVKEVERLVEEFIRRNEALRVLSDERLYSIPLGLSRLAKSSFTCLRRNSAARRRSFASFGNRSSA